MNEWQQEQLYRDFQRELGRIEDRKWRSDNPKVWERIDNPLEKKDGKH